MAIKNGKITIQREKLSVQVYSIIKEMIANHRFQPGSRINVEELARNLGVSRTPVWEAINRLEQEGLLENIVNRGVFMATLTPETALELYQVREALEGLAARLAATNITQDALKRMEICLREQRSAIEKGDLITYSRLDFDFHAAVYEASKNSVLQEMLQNIKTKMRPLALQVNPIVGAFLEVHEEILKALKSGDPDKAEQAFKRHNRTMQELIQERIDSGTWDQDMLAEKLNGNSITGMDFPSHS